ncbi:IS3 family transposase [Streptomyces sp. NPDC048566]|uniref:IS3 family transposase n=1 Tax=Streptomyces sp. NPDC048566 TaxID=3365569 RepID=UPI0037169CA7
MPRQPLPPSLQDQALNLLARGRTVKDVAAELHLSRSTLYRWRRASPLTIPPHLPDHQQQLHAAHTRIAELESELLAHRRLTRRLSDVVPPQGRFEAIQAMAAEGHPVRTTAALLRVSESGYYAWCRRAPSGRALRHARLSELILSIHRSSDAMYGSRRIHHELQRCYGISISRGTVELLMRQAGIQGRAGRIRWEAAQTLDSRTTRRLWVVDARGHHTSTGTLYSAVVLDTHEQRLLGWSVHNAVTHDLVHTALNQALTRATGPLLRSRLTAYAFTERTRILALAPATARVPDQYAQASVDHFWRNIDRGLPPGNQGNTTEDLHRQLQNLFGDASSPAAALLPAAVQAS